MSTTSLEPACDIYGRRLERNAIKRNGRIVFQTARKEQMDIASEIASLNRKDYLQIVRHKYEAAKTKLTQREREAVKVYLSMADKLKQGDSSLGRSARAAGARLLMINQKSYDERLYRAFAKMRNDKYENIVRRAKTVTRRNTAQ